MPMIRLATEADADQIRAIYAPFCRADSPISFEVEPPTETEIRRRIAATLARCPWLVCDDRGEIRGYVYANPHGERAAYRWSVNVSAYIASGHRGSGIGRGLYESLFALLKLQGFVNLYAGITLPNPASVGLHQALGFELVGVYREVGFKCGRWHDVGWYQRSVGDRPVPPDEPLSLAEAMGLPEWDRAIETGRSSFRATSD